MAAPGKAFLQEQKRQALATNDAQAIRRQPDGPKVWHRMTGTKFGRPIPATAAGPFRGRAQATAKRKERGD